MFPFSSVAAPEGSEYSKYAKYPPYCSIPEEMEKRAVPPLQGDSNSDSSKLIHVTALIRHGARTPFASAPEYQCWNGFWDDHETGIWNCDLKTYVSPPAATKEKKEFDSEGGLIEEEPDFLFEKRYDALTINTDRTGNELNGTCQKGQLLMRGYDQELQNGLHLRQAYFYDGDNTADEHAASDPRMRLWDVTKNSNEGRRESTPVIGDPTKHIFQEPNLHYRADDEQRTLMSGQVLLRGLFEPELLSTGDDEAAIIRLHTADYPIDVLHINQAVCPKTTALFDEAYASDEYKRWIENSEEVNIVKKFAKEELGMDVIPYTILDCLMTTICTDRTLPASLNDYDGSLGPTPWNEFVESSSTSAMEEGSEDYTAMFERIANFAIKNFTFSYKYNNAAYPKLGMGPLWKEIMANILPIIDSANNPPSDTPPPKLALFSGHDTTLMPILATLGDKVWDGTEWSPYASMIQLEIHETTDSTNFASGYAFRLIYNGKVLTSLVDGCSASSELCDSQVLVKQVMPFAKYKERDCASTPLTPSTAPPAEEGLVTEMKDATETLVTAPGGISVIFFMIVVSMALGSMVTFFLMKKQMQRTRGYRQGSMALGELSMRVIDDDDNHFQSEDGPVIDSAVSAQYGATKTDEKRNDDENNII